ncbi:uncharacterized protein LOC141627369 [Silene latifolia]|uniref:uncharacterized protein LOC141627369 n=1 Tax=Silene latifolia TaxID=37657 RepID=UPI003D785D29
MTHLITNFDSSDEKGWATTYMFIKADSVAPDLDYLSYPAVEGVADWACDPDAEGSTDLITAFMALPDEERVWPACLGQEPLPRFRKAKLSTYKAAKSAKASGASSSGTTRASARIASFGLSLVKAGVSQITGENSRSSQATGSDSTLQIQVPDHQAQLVSPPRVVVDEPSQAGKRKRSDEVSERVGGEGVSEIRARLADVQFAKEQI